MPGAGGATDVGINIRASDLASGPIGILAGNFGQLRQSFAQGMPRILGGFAAMAAGLASIGAGVAAFRTAWDFAQEAGEFEQEMAAVRSISNATEEQFNDLAAAATEAGIVTQFAPAEAAGGLRVLSQQGLIATDAIEGLVPVLDFAAAGNLSVAEAAEVAMGTMNAYGMTVDNMTSVTDRLMRGTQISALSANEFALVMGRAASSGQIFGTNLDDVIIALGSLRSSGIPATVATTSLGEAMRRLTTDRRAQQNLRRLNVEIQDQEGNLRSVIDITRDLQLAIADRTQAEQAQIVSQTLGVRGMREFGAIANIQARVQRGANVVTLQGAEAIAHYREQLANAGGTTERFRRDRLATFRGQMTLLSGTVQTFRTVFGRTFGVMFRPIMLAVTEAINMVARAWRNLSERTQIVIATLGLGGATFAIVMGVALTLGGAIALLIAVLGKLLLVVLAVSAGIAVALLPVFAGIAALAAAGFALYRAYQENLGGIADFVDGWVSRITLAWRALTEIISQDTFSDEVREQLGFAENAGIRPFVMRVRDLVRRIQTIWDGFSERFGEIWQSMSPVFAELRRAFENLMRQVFGVGGSLLETGNAIPFDRFSQFGATLANIVGRGLSLLIRGLTFAIRHGIALYRIFQPIIFILGLLFRVWWWGFTNITIPLLRLVGRLIWALLTPLRWLVRGMQAIGAIGETPAGEDERRGAIEFNPFDISGDMARETVRRNNARDSRERAESSRSRPAAADAEGRTGEFEELLALLGEGDEGGGRQTRIDNRVTVQVDRDQLADVVQSLNLDDDTGGGGVVTDEFGFPQSVF